MSFLREARRQEALLEALRQGTEPGPQAGLREQGGRLQHGLVAYRANAAASADRALQAVYPTVAAMLGAEGFAALARTLWRASPPCHGDLARWGADLPALIESRDDLAPWPYLADAARLDAALARCESAADVATDVASLSLLASHRPDRLRLLLRPGAELLASRWPVARLHAAHHGSMTQAGAPIDPNMVDLAAVRAALAAGSGESVVVARAGWRAVITVLDPADFAWMQALAQALPLAEALALAGPGFAFEPWLARALGAGWLLRVEAVADPSPGG